MKIVSSINKNLSHRLNILRSLAAFLVVAGHLTDALFQSDSTDTLTRLFIYFNSMGHHGVAIFFVLSGFLVGKKFLETSVSNDVQGYIVDRVVRIQIVLIPALVVGSLLDATLLATAGRADPACCKYIAMRFDLVTFLGNVVGLQTIFVPVFGSNGPLWSLANEIWYYLMFPLAVSAWIYRRRAKGIILALAFFACIAILPMQITKYWIIWLLGVTALLQTRKELVSPAIGWVFLAAFLLTAPLDLLRIPGVGFLHVLGTGASVALIINAYIHHPDKASIAGVKIFNNFSDSSYSLYLFHFPLIVFLVNNFPKDLSGKLFNVVTFGLWLILIFLIYAYAYAFYWLVERHYHWLRRQVRRLLHTS